LVFAGAVMPARANGETQSVSKAALPGRVAPGTAKMAALLEEINRKSDALPMQNLFANEARAAAMRARLTAMPDPMERAYAVGQLSVELLNAGEVVDALVEATNAMSMALKLPDTPQRFYDGLDLHNAL
jgi:hypothetical protein